MSGVKQNFQVGICANRKIRSACALAQPDQSSISQWFSDIQAEIYDSGQTAWMRMLI